MWQQRIRDERGASAVEYGLLIALIAAVITAAVILLGTATSGAIESPCNSLDNAGAQASCDD